jgi:hypothetical protein
MVLDQLQNMYGSQLTQLDTSPKRVVSGMGVVNTGGIGGNTGMINGASNKRTKYDTTNNVYGQQQTSQYSYQSPW